jgi:thiol-disulfide isomerase/thioredoxin
MSFLMKYFLALFIIFSLVSPTFSQNDPVPDYLTMQDFPDSVKSLSIRTVDGRMLTFGDMLATCKGKKVLIDIWGSWCRDCIIGYPKLEELRRQVGEKNVAYVFLSTDKDEEKWKHAIAKFNLRGEHYLLDGAWKNTLSSYIVLDWVPRYLVLDENGRVIMPKAIGAEDAAVKKALSTNAP